MNKSLHLDFETRAVIDIKLGVHKYAEHPATVVLCCAFKFDGEPAFLWEPSQAFPKRVIEHVAAGGRCVAHNMAFDRIVFNHVLRRQMLARGVEIPELHIEQTDCTMVRALALGLPGSLEKLCPALRLPVEKDMTGKVAMMKLCRPQKSGGQLVWNNDPALFQILYAYCIRDVEAEAPIDEILPRLCDQEQLMWFMSERINDRGLCVDVVHASRAAAVVAEEGKALSGLVSGLTRNFASATQRARLHAWLDNNGLELPDMKKHTVRDALKDETMPPRLRKVLELQTEATKSSTAKLKKMVTRACADGNARGEYRFNGASTARWSSTGIQLHNLTRPSKGFKLADAENVFGWLKYQTETARRAIRREYKSVMFAISNSIRPLLKARDGYELLCADFSNIEGRVLAWLAGEQWKLDAFQEYDTITGTDANGEPIRLGPDLYKLAFAKAFGVTPESVDDEQRQVGKVIELALGYQSGHGGFLAMAAGYDVDLKLVADIVHRQTSAREWARFDEMHDGKGVDHFGLERYEWVAIKVLITKWRDANSGIRTFWKELEDAAVAAVAEPGKVTGVNGKIFFQVADSFLWVRLPSGRKLAYAYPSLTNIDTPWGTSKASVRVYGTEKGGFYPYHMYGGLIAENVTQAIARDILGLAMLRLEAAQYPIVMHTHDEAAAEKRIGEGSLDEFIAIMCALPAWAAGLPVSVAGWRGVRYRKA